MERLYTEEVSDVCERFDWTLTVNSRKPHHATTRLLGRAGLVNTSFDDLVSLVGGFIVAVKPSGHVHTRSKNRNSRWKVLDAFGRVGDNGPVYQVVLNPDFNTKQVTIKTILRLKRGNIPSIIAETLSVSDDDYYDHSAIALGDFLREAAAAIFAREKHHRDHRNGGDSAASVEA